MAEIRALIVDDEPLARRGIRQLLAPFPDIAVVGECRDGREAVRALNALRPDLVFLDVQMPGLDGMEVVKIHGAERMPVTVFVTAHDEFAVAAFEAQALDYLVKPLSAARFRATIARVRDRLRRRDEVRRIAVPTPGGIRLLQDGEVDWIKAEDDYVVVHAGGARYRVRQPLSRLAARLDARRFVRVHRSCVVRLDQIRDLVAGATDGTAAVCLRDGTVLPVSRRRLAAVRDRLAGRSPRRSDRSPRQR
ncbi:MAG TPA: LytTR family DNA-binding domain-containing protein [Gemmatimonadales bacterium]|nr:LytTR family DNA-binding domain-containing protein [Gemmatimonadales bacterium]